MGSGRPGSPWTGKSWRTWRSGTPWPSSGWRRQPRRRPRPSGRPARPPPAPPFRAGRTFWRGPMRDLLKGLDALEAEATAAVAAADEGALEDLRVRYLGRRGRPTGILP